MALAALEQVGEGLAGKPQAEAGFAPLDQEQVGGKGRMFGNIEALAVRHAGTRNSGRRPPPAPERPDRRRYQGGARLGRNGARSGPKL